MVPRTNGFLIAILQANTRITTTIPQNIFNVNKGFSGNINIRKYATVSCEDNLKSRFFKPKLVIFDKDGTLVCMHTMWSPWCIALADKMNQATRQDLSEPLFNVLGYDHKLKRLNLGPMAENTNDEVKDKIEEMLVSDFNFDQSKAREVIDSTWTNTPENMIIKLTADVPLLFQRLKDESVKIAVCTSDSRECTQEFLEKMKLDSYLDMMVCGDDPESKPKPDPHNLLHICKNMEVPLSEAIMVGDTPADTVMGKKAQIGLTVGVLTGVGAIHDLNDADVIVEDVKECVDMMILSDSKNEKY